MNVKETGVIRFAEERELPPEVPLNNVTIGLGNTGTDDFEKMFDELITTNSLRKEVEVTPSFKVEIKTLSTEEVLEADAVYVSDNMDMPTDVILRIRAVNTIARAITKINGIPVAVEGDPAATIKKREVVRKKLLDSAPVVVDKINQEYRNLVAEQNKLLAGGEGIKNF